MAILSIQMQIVWLVNSRRGRGESLTDAVLNALRERLRREEARRKRPGLRRELAKIRERCSSLPVLDSRSPEEIIGYDERGLPR
jgi:antitoxin VapB